VPRAVCLPALLVTAVVAFSPAAAAQETTERRDPRDLIVLSGEVTIRRGDEVGEVIVAHGAVTVAGVVRGDVVVIDGSIDVGGQVSGSVIAVDGIVTLGPDSQVLGDVLARDRVQADPGARVGGAVREGAAFTFRTPIELFGPLGTWLAVAFSTLVLGSLMLFVAPGGAEAVARVARGSPWASSAIGLAVFIALPVIGLLALVSLVALPFGLGLLLALAFLWSVGVAWTAFVIGRTIWHAPRSAWLALLIGWAILAAVLAIPILGGIAWFASAVFGLGTMTLAVSRARRRGGRHRPGGKIAPERIVEVPERREPQPLITERAMDQEGTGI
jgi:cytoskeletal protein CcmA (bactofilin family)